MAACQIFDIVVIMSLKPVSTTTAYQGQIIRVIETAMSDGRVFEKAVRSPGTRNIIHDIPQERILLMKEFRAEINGYDFRLPGGKVRDKIEEWDAIKDSGQVDQMVVTAACKEMKEEVAIDATNTRLFSISSSGGPTVEWTLYYFVTTEFTRLESQSLEVGEDITFIWVGIQEAIAACLDGKMKEGRSAAVLLQYFHSIGKI